MEVSLDHELTQLRNVKQVLMGNCPLEYSNVDAVSEQTTKRNRDRGWEAGVVHGQGGQFMPVGADGADAFPRREERWSARWGDPMQDGNCPEPDSPTRI